MADTSPRLDLPYLQPSQAQKHVTHNEALQRLDAVTQMTVAQFDAVTPPTAPAEGEVYALGAVPTGAWAGQAGLLALWDGTAWQFFPPAEGWRAWGLAEAELRVFDGAAWLPLDGGLQNLDGVGIGTSWDTTNRLAVASPAVLLNAETADVQLKLNKAAAADTGSLLWQTAFSGRAEVGLAGSDDLTVKVSADGTTWNDALVADRSTGRVDVAQGLTFAGGTDVMAVYEAGTWTPSLTFGGASTGIAYSVQDGHFHRIGDFVWLAFDIRLSSKGTATGNAYVTGLPFTAAPLYMPGTLLFVSGGSGLVDIGCRPSPGPDIELYTRTSTGRSILTSANFTDTANFKGTLTFQI